MLDELRVRVEINKRSWRNCRRKVKSIYTFCSLPSGKLLLF
jgi:hypothetical protein